MSGQVLENNSPNLLKKMYRYYAESDNFLKERNKEIDEKIIQAFRQHYKGSIESMETFRDEIFGIVMQVQEVYFCEGIKCAQMLQTEKIRKSF